MITELTAFVFKGMSEDESRAVISDFCDVLVSHGLANEGISDDDVVKSVVVASMFDPSDDLTDEEVFDAVLAGTVLAVLPINKELINESDSESGREDSDSGDVR